MQPQDHPIDFYLSFIRFSIYAISSPHQPRHHRREHPVPDRQRPVDLSVFVQQSLLCSAPQEAFPEKSSDRTFPGWLPASSDAGSGQKSDDAACESFPDIFFRVSQLPLTASDTACSATCRLPVRKTTPPTEAASLPALTFPAAIRPAPATAPAMNAPRSLRFRPPPFRRQL